MIMAKNYPVSRTPAASYMPMLTGNAHVHAAMVLSESHGDLAAHPEKARYKQRGQEHVEGHARRPERQ